LTGAAGAAFSAQVTGSDADGDALTYSMTGGPTGLSLSSAGGLSWDKAVKGSYTLTVTAKDPSGAKGSGTIKLVIS
jgi:serine protease